MFAQLLVSGLAMGGIYSTLAVGFTLLWNTGAIVNFAQGEFAMLGMFFALQFLVFWKLPVVLSLIAAVILTMVVAIVLERLAIRHIYNKSAISIIIVTIGAQIVLSNGAKIVWGTHPFSFPRIFGDSYLTDFHIAEENFWILATVALLVVALTAFFKYTRVGVAMRAVAQDKEAAYLMGTPVSLLLMLAFAISAGLGGVAGILLAPVLFVASDIGLPLVLKAFMAAVIGGFGSYTGAFVGGMLIGVIDNLAGFYVSTDYRDVMTFSLLILLLLLKPTGLFATHEEVR